MRRLSVPAPATPPMEAADGTAREPPALSALQALGAWLHACAPSPLSPPPSRALDRMASTDLQHAILAALAAQGGAAAAAAAAAALQAEEPPPPAEPAVPTPSVPPQAGRGGRSRRGAGF